MKSGFSYPASQIDNVIAQENSSESNEEIEFTPAMQMIAQSLKGAAALIQNNDTPFYAVRYI